MLVLQAGLVQAHHAPLCFAGADQQDVGLAALALGILQAVRKQLIRGDDGDASPQQEGAPCDVCGCRRNPPLGALPLKGGDVVALAVILFPGQRRQIGLRINIVKKISVFSLFVCNLSKNFNK